MNPMTCPNGLKNAFALAAGVSLVAISATGLCATDFTAAPPNVSLGMQLFEELRFTQPGTNFQSSCAGCHVPPGDSEGRRAFADELPKSVIPFRGPDDRHTTRRNTMTLMDAHRGPVLIHEAEYETLEELVSEALTGRLFGWMPEERDQAVEEIAALIINDTGEGRGAVGSYSRQFKAVHGAEIEKLSDAEILAQVARAISDYVRTIGTDDTSPYDAFVEMNRMNKGPNPGEDPKDYAYRYFSRIGNQVARRALKRPADFSAEAFEGFKIFFRTTGDEKVGNCVSCHTPPYFTDFGFHNAGIAGLAALRDAGAEGDAATESIPGHARGEFKTPTLRNLTKTGPYMHNGAYGTIEAAVADVIAVSNLAREGKLAGADEEFSLMRLTEEEIAPLSEFLKTLTDVNDPEEYRRHLLEFERHMPDIEEWDF